MLEPDSTSRILIIQAESGRGKSTLLLEFSTHCENTNIRPVLVDLRSFSSLDQLLQFFCDELGESWLPTLVRASEASLDRQPITMDFELNDNSLRDSNTITIQPTVMVTHDQRGSYINQRLADAFFRDVRANTHKTVFIFDTFEASIPEIQAWLTARFLGEVRRSKSIYAVVAGQSVPPEAISYENSAKRIVLGTIEDVDAWYSFATRICDSVLREHIEALCAGTQEPNLLAMLIRNLCAKLKRVG